MLDQEDLKWIANTSINLTSILQQLARYTEMARRHVGQPSYIDLLGDRVDLGAQTAQALFDRVTSKILSETMARCTAAVARPIFTVMPSPQTGSTAATDGGPPMSQPAPVEITIPAEITVMNPDGNREYILVVEDDAEVRELAAEMLKNEGYKIIVARDGFEALEIYSKIGPLIGLVILDFFLPVMDGDAVFDELRAINPNIQVVLSSGFAEQDRISAMLAQGLRGFIPKPYTRQKLLDQVRSTLDNARERER